MRPGARPQVTCFTLKEKHAKCSFKVVEQGGVSCGLGVNAYFIRKLPSETLKPLNSFPIRPPGIISVFSSRRKGDDKKRE